MTHKLQDFQLNTRWDDSVLILSLISRELQNMSNKGKTQTCILLIHATFHAHDDAICYPMERCKKQIFNIFVTLRIECKEAKSHQGGEKTLRYGVMTQRVLITPLLLDIAWCLKYIILTTLLLGVLTDWWLSNASGWGPELGRRRRTSQVSSSQQWASSTQQPKAGSEQPKSSCRAESEAARPQLPHTCRLGLKYQLV